MDRERNLKKNALLFFLAFLLVGVHSLEAIDFPLTGPVSNQDSGKHDGLRGVSPGIDDLLPGRGRIGEAILRDLSLPAGEPFHSTTLEEFAPVQITGKKLPDGEEFPKFFTPCEYTRSIGFSGVLGKPAIHEGIDFVHSNSGKPHVLVIAAAPGVVAYVRTGCPQSSMFKRNTLLREAGAGWGNHVVLFHGKGLYTRYAHLLPDSIKLKPGDRVSSGGVIGEMGNSGRSEIRHLHFELGWKKTAFETDKPAQSFDLVFDPNPFLLNPIVDSHSNPI
ncbi:M23 family metallopeptidase [bacterium]|nr:M23 family metallopeptidase [bacterium]